MTGLARLIPLLLALPAAQLRAAPTTQPSVPGPCAKYLYIPPDLAAGVLFYHSFSKRADRPEINRLGARVVNAAGGRLAPGLTGNGYRQAAKKGGTLGLRGLSRPLTKPITVSLWFRLDAPMKLETSFHLISLYANGYLSNFVRGKGRWCALTEPRFVMQLYNFPGISNVNAIGGRASPSIGPWHHAAVSVSEGSRVRVCWDAVLRSEFTTKGRLFGAKDVVKAMDLGNQWLSHPMTIDEVLILRRALSPAEIGAYVTAVQKLAKARFPFRAPTDSPPRTAPASRNKEQRTLGIPPPEPN